MPTEPCDVSVVIPTFNRSGYLREAIASALSQTSPAKEVIVVNHASTDDTSEVIRSFGKEVTGIDIDPAGRGGVGTARNAGLQRATGRFVALLDDDDAWLPTKLESQSDLLPFHILVSSDADCIDADSEPIGVRYLQHVTRPIDLSLRSLIYDNVIILSTAVVRTDAVKALGGFATDPRHFMVEDYLLWLRLALRGTLGFVDQPLTLYRVHPGSQGKASAASASRLRRRVLGTFLGESMPLSVKARVARGLVREYLREAKLAVAERSGGGC